jgi:sugar lactone lactonase YvrE
MALRAVFTLDADGRVERKFDVPGRPSGLGWRPDGTLLVVSMEDRLLLAFRDGDASTVADLSSVATWHANDMVVDAVGRAYIGNFGWDYRASREPVAASLARVDLDGSVHVAADNLLFPNGVVLSADGRTMVVAETYGARLTAFDVGDDGSLSGRRVFAELDGVHPDGICLDAEGAVWVSTARGGEVIRVREGGEVTDRIASGRRGAFACALGGVDRRTLFICCADGSDWSRAETGRTGEIRQLRVAVAGAGRP